MRRIAAALLQSRRRAMVMFAMAEILLALAIPFVMIRGYHTLLDSRAGTFIEEPTRLDPGWTALVDHSEVIGIAEVDRGTVTGVVLVVVNPGVVSTGTVILVPGTLEIEGAMLSSLAPADAVAAVSETIRLAVNRTEVLDEEGWAELLDGSRYVVENPDPVPAADGVDELLLAVGAVEVGAEEAAAFVGRPAAGAVAVSVLPRRHLLWSAILAEPPATDGALADDLAAVDGTETAVIDLPVVQLEPVAVLDQPGAEDLIRDVVAFPAGAAPGDRLRVRLVDRTGAAPLEDVAAAVAAEGIEVVEIANALVFDGGATEVVAPAALASSDGLGRSEMERLARLAGVGQVVVAEESEDEETVTLIVGDPFALGGR